MLIFSNIIWLCSLSCPETRQFDGLNETIRQEHISIVELTPASAVQARPNNFFIRRRDQIGSAYGSMNRAVDRFISRRDFEDISEDKSFLKLELGSTFYSDGRTEDQTQLRVRAHLPNSEKRLRVFFDSDVAEDDDLVRTVSSVAQGQQIRDDSSTAGIQLNRNEDSVKRFKPSVSVGARFDSGLRSFIRFRLRKNEAYFGEHWSYKIRQDVWHLGSQGWGAGNRLEIKRQNKEANRFTFYSISNTDHKHYLDQTEFAQRWILNDRRSDTFSVEYQLGHISDSSLRSGFTRHFVSTSFLKQIYQDWVFLTLTPEIAYDFDESWQTEESLTVRFDIFFTD